jgi:hypothetical protein
MAITSSIQERSCCGFLRVKWLQTIFIELVEMANQILGDNWMPEYVAKANAGGIERVLV